MRIFLLMFILLYPALVNASPVISVDRDGVLCDPLAESYNRYLASIRDVVPSEYMATMAQQIISLMDKRLTDEKQWVDFLSNQGKYTLEQQNINEFDFINCAVDGDFARAIYHSNMEIDKNNTVGFFVVMYVKEKGGWKVGFRAVFHNMNYEGEDLSALKNKFYDKKIKGQWLLPSEK